MKSLLPAREPYASPPSKRGRYGLWFALALGLAGGAYYFAPKWFTPKPTTQYITVKAKREDIKINVSATGNVNPVNVVTVGSQISGPVTKVYVDFNDAVKKGQPLAEIDPALLNAQIEQSEAQLQNAKSAMELSQRDEARNKRLFEAGFISRSEWERIQQSARSAESSFQVGKAQLDRDRKNLEYALINSPVDGVVIARTVNVGQTVQASFQAPELFKIAEDLTNMQIDINLAEADVSSVKEGMDATFTVDAFPERTFNAKLSKLKLNPTNTNGTVTYQAVLSVNNEDKVLIPGMTAYVSLLIKEAKQVLAAPNASFRYRPSNLAEPEEETEAPLEENTATLYVLRAGAPVPLKITPGISDNRRTEITAGELKEGDEIILREERLDEEEG